MHKAAQIAVALTLPLILLISNVKLLTSDAFIHYEYNRAGFPADVAVPEGGYPLPKQERTRLAKIALRSVAGAEGIRLLEQARFEQSGQPAFNEREIRHMDDVRVLMGWSSILFWLSQLLLLLALSWLLHKRATRPQAARALWLGAFGALLLAGALIVLILLNFDFFFTKFHRLFFSGETWLFSSSDTLIRLFPAAFWSDAALIIGGLTALELVASGALAWRWERHCPRSAQ